VFFEGCVRSPKKKANRSKAKGAGKSPPAEQAAPGRARDGKFAPGNTVGAATQFPPGQSGNPNGRPPSAGESVLEWVNKLRAQGICSEELRKMAANDKLPWEQQTAAARMARTTERADHADFEDLFEGRVSIAELRKRGVNTGLIKRFRRKTKSYSVKDEPVEETTVELELHDRSGVDFDRILDRTNGRARQTVAVEGIPAAVSQSPQIIVEVLEGAEVAERYPQDKPGAADEDD
jgi:hypothetical protein